MSLPTISQIVFIVHSLWSIAIVYFYYLCGYSSDNCLRNLTHRLASINMFYVKIFQTLSTNAHILTQSQIEYMSHYTDKVPYDYLDVNSSFRDTLLEVAASNLDRTVDLCNQGQPIKAGTISLVYEGRMNGRHVAIKVKRNDIVTKLEDALDKV